MLIRVRTMYLRVRTMRIRVRIMPAHADREQRRAPGAADARQADRLCQVVGGPSPCACVFERARACVAVRAGASVLCVHACAWVHAHACVCVVCVHSRACVRVCAPESGCTCACMRCALACVRRYFGHVLVCRRARVCVRLSLHVSAHSGATKPIELRGSLDVCNLASIFQCKCAPRPCFCVHVRAFVCVCARACLCAFVRMRSCTFLRAFSSLPLRADALRTPTRRPALTVQRRILSHEPLVSVA